MNGGTHRAIAVATVTGLSVLQFPTMRMSEILVFPVLGLLVADAGGKIADIDMDTTSYGKKYPLVSKFTTHRGMTHTGLILLLMTAIFKLCGYLYDSTWGIWVEDLMIMFILTGGLNVSMKTKLTANLTALLVQLFMLVFLSIYSPMWINIILCSLVFGFLLSYGSHEFADMHNRKGIPIAYPICRRKIYVAAFATGTWEEYLFLGIYIFVIVGQIVCTKFGIGLL